MLMPLTSQQRTDLETATAEYERHLDLSAEFLQARGISQSTAVTFRLGSVPTSEGSWLGGRLAIPSIGASGVCSLRFRCLQAHDHGDPSVECQKYLGFPGIGTRLFNVRAADKAHDILDVTEGELDSIILEQLGFRSVGVPGATNWKPHYTRVLAGFDLVRVWGDGDAAGREFARIVTGAVGGSARAVNMPNGLDVNELYLQEGEQGVRNIANTVQG